MPASTAPIIDSHIHLYPSREIPSLAWCTPSHPLASQHSVAEYLTATGPTTTPNLSGFIFVETDRHNASSTDWTAPLQEIAWMRRLATGTPRSGEGHSAADARLCLGLVPWAPVALGPEKLGAYLEAAEREAGTETWRLVKGFRYLLQDKENGTALGEGFVEGLKVLGRKGYVFDVGVDQHRRGRVQLEELIEMIDRAHEGVEEGEKVVFVLNHLCKPDLTILNQTDPSFIAWRTAMFTLSKCRKTYMKLSGCFSELPDKLKERSAEDIFSAILPWLAVVVAAFGPSRIMFGSDWPVCTVGVGGEAWKKWHRIVEMVCDLAGLSEQDQAMLWGGTAKEAYKLDC
ncbi:amidohydrolase 2 [Parathielavia appendiculata]|uniref:Amidohydrolase 2 n=1 Tax=Parathielavia appendiculata TaxID=2587402 RepID=A0AAN6TW96_9PEZI|nr:amidohydrolase 2 [Parathielavia appendiculata]